MKKLWCRLFHWRYHYVIRHEYDFIEPTEVFSCAKCRREFYR